MLKNWMLVLIGGIGFLIIGAFGLKSLKEQKLNTPIPRIEPQDSLNVKAGSSRLENYRREMEEIQEQHVRKQLAMEKIIAMDFGATRVEGKEREVPEEILKEERKKKVHKQKAGPERGRDKPKVPSQKKNNGVPVTAPIEEVIEKEDTVINPFYTIKADAPFNGENSQEDTGLDTFFKAIVDGDQKLLNNSTVRLRLLEEVRIGEYVFPRNTLINGRLSSGGEGRIKIRISSIRNQPVKMRVYDQDFQEGVAYTMEEPLPASLEESRDQALDQLLFSVPYGGVFSGVAEAGRRMLQKNRRSKPLYLADGYPLYISFEKNNFKR